MGSLTPTGTGAKEGGFLATRTDALINWGRKNSLWPMPLGLSCCGIELMAMIGPKFDIARFGAEAARFSPRQCDVLIVAGTLTWKMAEACRTIYDQMPDPKWVIAMGVCSSSGGMYDSYAVVQGVDMILPVDVYVPGCPPRPDAVIDALLKLQRKIERESPVRRLAEGEIEVKDGGTTRFFMPPNKANSTRRIGTFKTLDAEEDATELAGAETPFGLEEADADLGTSESRVAVRETGKDQSP